MAESNLTAQRLREVLNYSPETGVFTWKIKTNRRVVPGRVAGSFHPNGYRRLQFDGAEYLAHRLAWLYVHGDWPEDQIDHINGVRDDNRIQNLRDATSSVNNQNRRSPARPSRSGLLGAHWFAPAGLWHSAIRTNGSIKDLGYFRTPEEAHAAYVAAKRRLHEGCTI